MNIFQIYTYFQFVTYAEYLFISQRFEASHHAPQLKMNFCIALLLVSKSYRKIGAISTYLQYALKKCSQASRIIFRERILFREAKVIGTMYFYQINFKLSLSSSKVQQRSQSQVITTSRNLKSKEELIEVIEGKTIPHFIILFRTVHFYQHGITI